MEKDIWPERLHCEEKFEERVLSEKQNQLLSQLEVDVSIELGNVTLSAATLIDWVVGERVLFSVHKDDSVMLLIGGVKIARAHLVKDSGEIFLEIAEIYEETVAQC